MTRLLPACALLLAALAGAAQDAEPAAAPEPGTVRVMQDIEFVWVPAGRFTPGLEGGGATVKDALGGREEWHNDEAPRAEAVFEKGFWMSRTEITRTQWRRVMDSEPWLDTGAGGGQEAPATGVTWHDAAKFAKTLGKGAEGVFRLPTENEWEYACRAGSAGLFPFEGTDASALAAHAWFRGNTPDALIQDVGQKTPNAWGLLDMLGNAWEWCADERVSPGKNGGESARALRGGAANQTALLTRPTARAALPADQRGPRIGFRIVCAPDGE